MPCADIPYKPGPAGPCRPGRHRATTPVPVYPGPPRPPSFGYRTCPTCQRFTTAIIVQRGRICCPHCQ